MTVGQALSNERVVGRVGERWPGDRVHRQSPRPKREQEDDREVAAARGIRPQSSGGTSRCSPRHSPHRIQSRCLATPSAQTAARAGPASMTADRALRGPWFPAVAVVRAEPVDRVRRQRLRDREVTGGHVIAVSRSAAAHRDAADRHIAAVTTLALWAVLISRGAVDLIALTVLSRPYPRHSSLGTSSSAIALSPHITRALNILSAILSSC